MLSVMIRKRSTSENWPSKRTSVNILQDQFTFKQLKEVKNVSYIFKKKDKDFN